MRLTDYSSYAHPTVDNVGLGFAQTGGFGIKFVAVTDHIFHFLCRER